MPPQRTRTRSWSGPISGVAISSTRKSPGAWMTSASMMAFSERGRDAAIDIEDVAVDEGRGVAGEEHRGADQVFDIAPAARRRAVDEPAAELGVVDERLRQLGLEVAGAEAVDLDAVLAPVDRHALGEHLHRALAGGVRRDVRPPELALHRADVDDFAALARDHPARHRLADDEDAVDIGAHQLVPVGLGEFVG